MTPNPKDKANELIEKYYDILPLSNRFQSIAIQCALIAVEEVLLNEKNNHCILDRTTDYWQEVKNEFNNDIPEINFKPNFKTTTVNAKILSVNENNQETLEEFIKKYHKNRTYWSINEIEQTERNIRVGAKWQTERSYNEEEVSDFVEWLNLHYRDLEITKSLKNENGTKELLKQWDKEFKK